MQLHYKFILSIFFITTLNTFAQQKKIMPGANRVSAYLPLLKGKRVAIFANQTSVVGNTHLVDTLLALGIKVVVIFGPEHGFRGTADAGEKVNNKVDTKTKIPIISLYGSHKKPTPEDISNVDILLYDIQDVGIRFYTYISSLEYYMEAAFENRKELIILDRPNPNGYYVDGPVLEKEYKSFVGMQPIPIVYGLTVAEYAYMLAMQTYEGSTGIGLSINPSNIQIMIDGKPLQNTAIDYLVAPKGGAFPFKLHLITCNNYTHASKYLLPVAPSPNLRLMQGIYCYPSTCFFEGTVLSEGRGTPTPFQLWGHPGYSNNKKLITFTPQPNTGAKSSKLYGQLCYGWQIKGNTTQVLKTLNNQIQLSYLLNAYSLFTDKANFFIAPTGANKDAYFFDKLAGNNTLRLQIIAGKSEADIKKSWQPKQEEYKAIRKKYLLYE